MVLTEGSYKLSEAFRGKPGGGDDLRRLSRRVPEGSDFRALLDGLDDPEHLEPSRDRYIAIVASGAVEHGLQLAIGQHLGADLSDQERGKLFKRPLGDLSARIDIARGLGIVTSDQAVELHRIRDIRNTFAHTITPLSFDAPEVIDVLDRMWHYPVRDWSSYFAPVFPRHHQFMIVCASFYAELSEYRVGRPPSQRPTSDAADGE